MDEIKSELIFNKMKNQQKNIYQITPVFIKDLIQSKIEVDFSIKNRKRPKPYFRCIYYRLCKDFTECSLAEIGFRLNEKNPFSHASVIHGINNFETWKDQNWFIDYYKLYQALALSIYKEKSGNKASSDFLNIDQVKHYYKIQFIKMVEKYRNVINKQYKEIYNMKTDPIISKIAQLDQETLDKLKPRLESFLLMNINNNKV